MSEDRIVEITTYSDLRHRYINLETGQITVGDPVISESPWPCCEQMRKTINDGEKQLSCGVAQDDDGTWRFYDWGFALSGLKFCPWCGAQLPKKRVE